jgi:predicted Zn-dependent protease
MNVPIETLPAIPVERVAVDEKRRQVMAEEMIALLKAKYPALANDAGAALIGLTTYDMYMGSHPEWAWSFSGSNLPRFAVISIARMNPVNFNLPADPDRLDSRLRKMVTQYIGFMYFDLPHSANRTSVMFPVRGLNDLDDIAEDF